MYSEAQLLILEMITTRRVVITDELATMERGLDSGLAKKATLAR